MEEHIKYFDNGKPSVKGSLIDGKKHGLWVYYSDDGRVSSEFSFKYGLLHGKVTFYTHNGGIRCIGHYHEGLLHGEYVECEVPKKFTRWYKTFFNFGVLVSHFVEKDDFKYML